MLGCSQESGVAVDHNGAGWKRPAVGRGWRVRASRSTPAPDFSSSLLPSSFPAFLPTSFLVPSYFSHVSILTLFLLILLTIVHYCTLLLYFTHYFTYSILPLTQATTAHRARHATNHAQKPPSATLHTRSNPVSPPPPRQPARSPSSSLPQPPPLSVTDSHRTIAFAHHRPGTRATSLPHHTRPRASTEHLPTRNGAANPPLPICDCPLRRRPRIRTKPVATLRLPEP